MQKDMDPSTLQPSQKEYSFSLTERAEVRTRLLDWYDSHHRVLPWRRNAHSRVAGAEQGARPDMPPNEFLYSVWVCEVMCQQTQVARAAAYFTRWMARWPTVQALAAASLHDVNELWAGLGYYRRAKSLLDGAKHVVEELGGSFPATAAALQKIPGIGAYTAAAVASIAGGEAVAAVDANVVRVLCRLRAVAAPPQTAAAGKLHAALAGQLLDPDRPGDFNQAMMELGARICTGSRAPDCAACPLGGTCRAHQQERAFLDAGGDAQDPARPSVTQYPAKVKKAKRREEAVAVCVLAAEVASKLPPGDPAEPKSKRRRVARGRAGTAEQSAERRYLLLQRPEKGLLAGLWEFPSVPAGSSAAATRRSLQALLQARLGSAVEAKELERKPEPLGSLTHVFSHINLSLEASRLTVQVARAPWGEDGEDAPVEHPEGPAAAAPTQQRWLTAAELGAAGLSSSMRKVWALHCAAKEEQPEQQQQQPSKHFSAFRHTGRRGPESAPRTSA